MKTSRGISNIYQAWMYNEVFYKFPNLNNWVLCVCGFMKPSVLFIHEKCMKISEMYISSSRVKSFYVKEWGKYLSEMHCIFMNFFRLSGLSFSRAGRIMDRRCEKGKEFLEKRVSFQKRGENVYKDLKMRRISIFLSSNVLSLQASYF